MQGGYFGVFFASLLSWGLASFVGWALDRVVGWYPQIEAVKP